MTEQNLTTIATASTFQERMFERVRESLSELLTEEEAKALVERAIQESLFKHETVRVGGYSGYDKVQPSRFEELVKEAVEPLIKESVTTWLAEHSEEVKVSIQEVVEQGIAGTVVKVFREEMRQPTHEMGGRLQQVINKLGGI